MRRTGVTPRVLFQSSPVPKDGCNTRNSRTCWSAAFRFNPHPSRRTGATCATCWIGSGWTVSILTRPEGRVQLVVVHGVGAALTVSILTRPEGRVQPCSRSKLTHTSLLFQSSPVPKDGCNSFCRGLRRRSSKFQSSPVPKDGCNAWSRRVEASLAEVSILTRPEGRVQRISGVGVCYAHAVSILTRPEGRVQRLREDGSEAARWGFNPHPSRRTGATGRGRTRCRRDFRFNPHPSRRTGATGHGLVGSISYLFQSSPVPKDGCNAPQRSPRHPQSWFQSSPVPKDGCNPTHARRIHRLPGCNPHPSRRTGATPYNRTKFNTAVELSRPTTVLNGAADDFHPHYTAFLRICQVIWLTSMPANLTLGA